MEMIEPIAIILTFGGGVVTSLITLVIRDAILKNTLKHKIAALEELRIVWDKVNERQDSEIRITQNEVLSIREKFVNLRERFDEFQKVQSDEIKSINENMSKVAQSVASLDATLKGLTGWLKRVDEKLDRK